MHCGCVIWKSPRDLLVIGRVENEHAITASNLFKYCEPAHGLVLFKRHEPLAFTAPELHSALHAASEWLRQAWDQSLRVRCTATW